MKGFFKPKNPNKYEGDSTNIIYRSSWELKVMLHLDSHPDVLKWSSEEIRVPYLSPMDNKTHLYYPDFIIKQKDKNNNIRTIMIEVKPFYQTQAPEIKKKITKRYITEVKTWGVNSAKWKYAREYCKKRGWEFMILTEKEIFGNG